MRSIFSLFFLICLASATQGLAEEGVARQQIRQWIQQLGNDSFLVRERAESLLIRAGIQAYPDLQRARQSHDLEIVRRAEYVLSKIEHDSINLDDQEAAFWIQSYMTDPNPAGKARIIWALAAPTLDLKNGEGLQTLCRFVRFEENAPLRLESVKTLIAFPPVSLTLRQKWYRHIRDTFQATDDDELFQCLANYAKLWCDLDEADNKTTPAFQEQVRKVAVETLSLLKRPENHIQVGSKTDILLHYAVAELQDAAGLAEDRDKTAAAALAVESEPIRTPGTLLSIGDDFNDLPGYEHFHAAECLRLRLRLHWAKAHYQKVIETGHEWLRGEASRWATEVAVHLSDYSLATAYWDKNIEILSSGKYQKETETVPTQWIAYAKRQKLSCLAEKAAAEGNWEGVREAILDLWATTAITLLDSSDMDTLILAYRLCKRQPDIDTEFKDKTESSLKQIWESIVDEYDTPSHLTHLQKVPHTCNSAAWLLANTDGDYQSALTLIEATLKSEPDNALYLDTLAHVHFLGGKVEEAIRTQEQVVRLAPEVVIFRQALERFKQQ